MREILKSLTVLSLLLMYCFTVQAQTTGAIGGVVVDSNGAVVPNATITAKGVGGEEFTAVSDGNGTYRIPAVANGIYTVTVTSVGFKTAVISNVKVNVGIPTTVDTTLEIGDVQQTVEVSSGGEVLQTQTATVGTNIQGRQVTETPIASRDALDLVGLMPGTASVGRPRSSSINGLPKSALTITLDGVDVQANDARSSDGYFTYIRPRVDAIEEVTVSTANPGAESGGDGAVQIRFVTKRGTNNYNGGVFWQHRNDALNAAYWYNNRDFIRNPVTGFEPDRRNKIRLNQYGGRYGGPLPFPNFGEGGKFWNSGKDKAFFFFNYEEFRQPETVSRVRTILTPDAQNGIFKYIVNGQVKQRNLLTEVAAITPGQTSTIDPLVGSLLARIRAATATEGSVTPILANNGTVSDPNRLNYNFSPSSGDIRKFFALRLDFNVHKNHSIEFVMNRQRFLPSIDTLNGQEERFPGFPEFGQSSLRTSYTGAVRSTFGSNIVNEARYTASPGRSLFGDGITPDVFSIQGGYDLGIGAAGITSATNRNSFSSTSNPTFDFTDTVTWSRGSHNISFGGQYKRIKLDDTDIARVVPSIGFGIDSADTAAFNMFNTTNIPDASPAQLSEARSLYGTLIGRITSFAATARLTADGTYKLNAAQTKRAHQDTYGLFIQDNWRVRPNLTVNYGIRWQPQGSYVVDTANYSRLESPDQIYGVSGVGNLFKPGTLTGTAPRTVALEVGEETFNNDLLNFAPTAGVVWSPDFKENSFFRRVLGASGKSVFRGGYSISYTREGTSLIGSIVGANPGGFLTVSRSISIGNLKLGTDLRTPGNPNLTPEPFPESPAYPITLTTANAANAFDPNLKTGSVHSFSFGYQRELDRNTVVEIRYVGNRGIKLQRQHDLNEFNTIENGFASEFVNSQNNLYANEAAFQAGQTNRRYCPNFVNLTNGNCQVSATNTTPVNRIPTFAYFGPGTNTSPLPIALAYFNRIPATLTPGSNGQSGSVTGAGASIVSNYTSPQFANSTLIANLSRNAPSIVGFGSGSNYELNTARRANAIAAGLPSNFFYVSPTTASAASTGAYIVDNSAQSWYDSGVIEVRRRLSGGLRLQANYVWSKAQSDSFASNGDVFANFSNRENGRERAKNVQVFDIRHNFKVDATYDLPFGKGRKFFGNAGWLTNQLIGGFTILPAIRWQSGSPFTLGNVQLVGMTVKELQKEVKVRKLANVVTYLPDDIILNTQKAFNIDVSNTANNGYGVTYGTGGPQGRFIAPAGYGNCQQRVAGDCGFRNLIIYGPSFFKYDMTVAKRFIFSERLNVELKATILDVLNAPNFRVGGFGADVVNATVGGATFGQLAAGSAYRDLSTTNDPGGRLIDLMLRINF